MRFTEIYEGWQEGRISQQEAAQILGVCERSFRRYCRQFEEAVSEDSHDGLVDRRLSQISHRRAPVDEVMALVDLYRSGFDGWNVKHFYAHYCRLHHGVRGYTWVKETLQKKGVVKRARKVGAHRKHRERVPLPGMMLHQDASTHAWIESAVWDLVVTMDDATSEQYDMRFVAQESTASSLAAMTAVIEAHGLPSSFYSDRGSHYWFTPEAGGRVDKINLTQFGRALKQLGITMIAAYSPQARGRSERMFQTHQGRLPKELKKAGITTMDEANDYLQNIYMPAFNDEFKCIAAETGTAFIPWIGAHLKDVLCEQFERVVDNDNCVHFERLRLQIPQDIHRHHYVKTKVNVHRYPNNHLALFHGPRKLADYDCTGTLTLIEKQKNTTQKKAA